VPKAHWHATLTRDGKRRLLQGILEAEEIELAAGEHELTFHGVRDVIDSAVTDLEYGVGDLTHVLTVRGLAQDAVPAYPIGDVLVEQQGRRDHDGVVHLDKVRVENRAGGTTVDLAGGIDVGQERRSLSLHGSVTQDLAKLWTVPDQLSGRGQVTLRLRLESGNLRLFHTLAAVKIEKADVRIPRAKLAIEGLDGEIPITADVVFDKGRPPRLLRQKTINQYSEMRFADQHPLLRSRSFITLQRLVTPQITLGPLAGNLRIEHNIVSLSQLELGLRGGRITGQCLLEYKDLDSVVQLHVRASNVGADRGQPFDGNTAVILSMHERTLDGRAEILRISKRHLLDALDVVDPHHADGGMNRVRRALALGYPDKVRLGFNHGFANARITLGGLARFIRIDELRGIPIGPLIDRALAPLHKKEEDEE
jgi:translocation and assembly module TamB